MSDSPSPGLNHSSDFEKVMMKGRRVRSRISGAHKQMVRSIEKRASRNTSQEIEVERLAPNYEMISPSLKVNKLKRQRAVRINEPAPETDVDNMQDVEEVVRELLSVSGLDSSLLEDPRKKKEVYNFVKKNQVARAVTMKKRSIKPKTAVSGDGSRLTDPSSNLTPRSNPEEDTTTHTSPTPPPPPLPPPPPPPSPPASALTPSTLEPRNLEKKTSEKQDAHYSKPADFLAEIRLRGQMENGGLASVNDATSASAARPPPADEDNSLTATLQRGLEHIFNAVHSDNGESDVGDSDSDSETGDSWDEDAGC